MWNTYKSLTAFTLAAATLSACATVPIVEEPVIQAPVVVQAPPPPTCFEVASLQRVEIPAETKTVTGISLIENPPYEPIEQRTQQKIVIKQAEVFYAVVDPQTGNQTEVTNFCDKTVVTGPVGPGLGETIGAPTQG